MKSGQITINGITDADLIMILREKEKTPSIQFNPQLLQGAQLTGGQAAKPGYNNCVLSCNQESALKGIYTILHKIIHGHESEPQ